VRPNAIGRDVIPLAEVGDQRLCRRELTLRWGLLVEITNQADADTILVGVMRFGIARVSALLLICPSARYFDLSIGTSRTIANHKMVATTIDAKQFAMFAVNLIVVASARGTVVQHDVPPRAINFDGIQKFVGIRLIEIGA
jgi:hypothetical protein